MSVVITVVVACLTVGEASAGQKKKGGAVETADLLEDQSPELVSASSRGIFNKVKDKILIVQCDDSAGSGFVCEMSGRRFFVTNRHVIEGQTRIAAYFIDGKTLKFKPQNMEVAKGVDLVRFAVATNQPAFSLRVGDPDLHEKIFVFGNSDGNEVFTDLPGTIEGVGPDKVEVTSKFVHGNSGSAVLDEDCRVVGVASYAVSGFDPKDWVKKDSRFNEVLRFALRLQNIKWVPCGLKELNRMVAERKRKNQEEAGVVPQVSATFRSPSMRINRNLVWQDMEFSVNGPVVLNMSGNRNVKNPLVRIVVLVDCNGLRYVFDRFAIEPSGKYLSGKVPVYTYGMPSTGYSYDAGNGIFAYYLEGISYYQRSFSFKQMKGIEYFDRSKLMTGGFKLPIDLTRRCDNAHPPKVLAFRLECWQNGSLAGVYNSTRPNTLNSKMIPVDWFIMDKYKKLFTYEAGE